MTCPVKKVPTNIYIILTRSNKSVNMIRLMLVPFVQSLWKTSYSPQDTADLWT